MKRLTLLFFVILSSYFSQSQDLQVTVLNSPSDGCQLSTSESIWVTIWNSGGITHGGQFTVNYTLNAGPIVSVSNVTPIANGAVYNFTFPVPDDFSACQQHDLVIWVDGISDVNHANDTLWTSVISDCQAIPGTITGPTTICEGINDDTVHVWGQNGAVIAWESSPDGSTWTTYTTSNDYYHFTNLPSSTIWRVIVDSPYGICGPDTSSWFTILADQQSDAGVLPADFDICDNGNNGWIHVTGYFGNIIDWNLSTNFGGGWIPLGNPGVDSIEFVNLQNTTQYQVIVKNGVCPADTSAMINLNLIAGTSPGTITGPNVVCNFENDDSLVACCGNGTVNSWLVSTDGGNSWQQTTETDSVFNFAGLQTATVFSAVWQFGTCPVDTANHEITVYPVFTQMTPDTTIDEGTSISLDVCCGDSFLWWPDQFIDDINTDNPIITPDTDITYYVQVTTADGCKDTARVNVTVLPDLTTLLIPNLITPNADGFNDIWQISNIESYTANELTIFNIYGQVIYQASPYNNEWDAQYNNAALPDGSYMYLLRLNDPEFPDPIQGVVTVAGNE